MLSIPPDSKRLTTERSGWAPGDLCARVSGLPAAGGFRVVYYSNRCSLLLTAFCCILVHFDAFSKISLHSILLHS